MGRRRGRAILAGCGLLAACALPAVGAAPALAAQPLYGPAPAGYKATPPPPVDDPAPCDDFDPDDHPEDPANVALIVRPAVNWQEDHHYIVALRDLRDKDGNLIPAPQSFRVFRDNLASADPHVSGRRARMNWIFDELRRAGIHR